MESHLPCAAPGKRCLSSPHLGEELPAPAPPLLLVAAEVVQVPHGAGHVPLDLVRRVVWPAEVPPKVAQIEAVDPQQLGPHQLAQVVRQEPTRLERLGERK
jgi:hypothetical protein